MGNEGRDEASPEDVVKWLESPEGEEWRIDNIEMISTAIAGVKPDNELHAGSGASDCAICNGHWRSLLARERTMALNWYGTSWNPEEHPECA